MILVVVQTTDLLSEFISESVKSNIDVINNLNKLKLGSLNYDRCPGMNPIVNASRTFHEKLADKCKLHSINS